MQIHLPNNFTPRDYQATVWEQLERGTRRAVCVWHRRAGKDLTFVHWTACKAFERVGLYWHMLPTFAQGRKIVWNGMDKEGRPFLDAFPEETVLRKRDDEMTMWLHGGSIWQVVGTDHIDRLVGGNPIGVVVSEYSLHNPAAWELIRPILAENGGWAAFIYTPRGRNHGFQLLQRGLKSMNRPDSELTEAQRSRKWFAEVLTRDDTEAVSLDAIEDDRESGMPEEMIQQEYYCVTPECRVHASHGFVPIKDIRVGHRVLTHTGRFRRVTGTMQRGVVEAVVAIQTYGHYAKMELTANHEVRVLDPASQAYLWKAAGEIEKGDWLVMPRGKEGSLVADEDFAFLTAWYITEGSLQKTAVQWALGHKEMEVAERICEAATRFGKTHIRKVDTGLHVQVNSASLADHLGRLCGSLSHEKRIPWEVASGREGEFLHNLLDGDGCKITGGWMYTTTSPRLAQDVQLLAATYGYGSGVAKRVGGPTVIEGRTVNAKDSYCVRIANPGASPRTKIRPAKNGIGVRVRQVSREAYAGRVHNLAVQHDESYTVEGRIVHNCSFDAPLVGAYFGKALAWMRKQKPPRIGNVAHVPSEQVLTAWDLGRADSTAIWFSQYIGREWRLIDYEEFAGEDVAFYVQKLREKSQYIYGDAYIPHDGNQLKLGQEKTVLAQLIGHGVKAVLLPKYPVVDQVAATRLFLRQVWIDQHACERGIEALSEYVKKPIENERGPDGQILYRDEPLHNWASHGASALAQLAMGGRPPSSGPLPQPDCGYVT